MHLFCPHYRIWGRDTIASKEHPSPLREPLYSTTNNRSISILHTPPAHTPKKATTESPPSCMPICVKVICYCYYVKYQTYVDSDQSNSITRNIQKFYIYK